MLSKTDFENKCDTFITNVKYYIDRYGVENIYNSDQIGPQLELNSGHILSHKSVKTIESVVQSTGDPRSTFSSFVSE